jgi:hypothetical protein
MQGVNAYSVKNIEKAGRSGLVLAAQGPAIGLAE